MTATAETVRVIGFFALQKYDAKTGELTAVLGSETADRAGEIMDYARSKPRFKAWIEAMKKASGGKSLGPVREMHQATVAAGKQVQLTFDDRNKRFITKIKVVDPLARQKVEEGVYTGVSVGGDYGDSWADPADASKTRYEAIPSEISLADIPCNPDATFELVGADGLTKTMKFAPPPPEVIAADERDDVPSFTAQVFGGRALRKSLTRNAMSDAAINPEELRKAMKKAARHAAKKQVKKALAAFGAEDGPLMKALANLATKDDLKKVHDGAVAASVTAVVAALTSESDKPDDLKKAALAIRLVPDDEGKTGEDQSDEAKALRKTITEAQGKLQKLGGGTSAADASRRRVAGEL